MKKSMFTKFLALFLTGAMLTNVGCKDYDSDIDDINKRLDDLKGTVALKTDLESLKKTQEAFNKIDFTSFVTNSALQTKLDQTLKDYAKKSDLKAWLTSQEVLDLLKSKGYMTKTEIETLIANSSTDAAEVAKIFDNMLTGQAIMGKIQADVQKLIQDKITEGKFVSEEQMKSFVEGKGYMTGASDLSASQLNQVLTAVAASVSDETSAVRKALDKWLGPEMDKYMGIYITGDEFKAAVGVEATKVALAELAKNNETFTSKVEGLIKDAITGQDFTSFVKVEDLEKVKTAYDKQISALWDAIGNLASRIQSLVFVPETIAPNMAFFKGQTLDGIELIKPRFELTFAVSPAILADKIAKTTVLLAKGVTRAAVPVVESIVGDNTTGEIKLVITDVIANYEADKAMAVALKIQDKGTSTKPGATPEEDSSVDTGIDFTSAYVALVAAPSDDIDGNFVLVNKTSGKAYDGAKVIYELDYTLADAISIMSDYEVKYQDGKDSYIAISGDEVTPGAAQKYHWDATPVVVWENTSAKFGKKDTNFATGGTEYKAAADLTASVFQQPSFVPTADANKGKAVAVQLKADAKNKPASIGSAFYLKRAVKVQLGENAPVALAGSFEGQVNVINHSLGNFDFDLFINWKYASWKAGFDASKNWSAVEYAPSTAADGSGKSYVTLPAGRLTVEQFNALAGAGDAWKVTNKANFKPKADDADLLVVTAKPYNRVVEPTDAQTLQFTVKNYKNGYGSVVVAKECSAGNGEVFTITATLNFAQPFEDADLAASLVSSIPFSTATQAITPKDWIKTLYTANATLPKFGFTTEALFTEYVDMLTTLSHNCEFVGLDGTNHPVYNAVNHSVDITLTMADFTDVAGNYFTTDLSMSNDDAPFAINFGETSKILVTKSAQLALAQQWQFGEKAWGTNPKDNSNKYEVQAVELLNYYNIKVADATKKVVFSLVTDGMTADEKTQAALASINSDNKLNWGSCNLTSLKLKAALVSLDGKSTFDAVEFSINLKTPISVSTIASRPAAETKQTLTAGGDQFIKLVNMLTWKDIDGNELVDKNNNTLFSSTFAGSLCYKASIDWSKATFTLTSGGATLPNTPLTLNADGTIKYNITNIDATQTYKVTVSGIYVGARYNDQRKDMSLSFDLVPAK